jgi:DNA (cytosine-5)-methyltransferase 1
MFGLEVERHRSFESSELMLLDRYCRHSGRSLTVTGHSPQRWDGGRRPSATTLDINRAMGIDWMNRREIVEAIPPAYTEWIGAQLLRHLERAA